MVQIFAVYFLFPVLTDAKYPTLLVAPEKVNMLTTPSFLDFSEVVTF